MFANRRIFDVFHRRSKVCLLTEEILMYFIGEANSTMFANRRNFDVFHKRGKVCLLTEELLMFYIGEAKYVC